MGTELMKLEKVIEMPGLDGRIDHMAINIKDNIIYVAALGNNTVEVVDLNKGVLIHSIKGIEEPQGIAYIPEQNEIAVAGGDNGDCVFINAATFKTVATIRLNSDADNIRYDADERKIYVGYGNGGIALLDPASHKQTGNVKLSAHPESFQLDKKNNRMYVNLPDANSIAIIDLKNFTLVHTWNTNKYKANFPMTLDTSHNLVFIGYRHPAMLVGYNSNDGREIYTNELAGDADDIFYDEAKQEIFATGGDGSINIFKKINDSSYKKIADIPTRQGARTSLLIPSLQTFVVAERAANGKSAALAVYRINAE
ncbi:YncE family protein [Panacibacter ginsenosidivorans]|uniref:YncE family protein n=2 Tax=Panacibacter ginsenosidivorans TaxID=1813871 RepID=A0A5B8VFP2_9BACT|nr:YncE family protein [Panacibacter ginsenosidivorans]